MTNQPQNNPQQQQVSVAEISKLRQEQSLVAGLEMYHTQLMQRSEAYSMQSGLGNAHRALLYLQSEGYGNVADAVRGMPCEFKPIYDMFVKKVEEIQARLTSQLGNRGDIRKAISDKLTLELMVNQHGQSTQLFIPVKGNEKSEYEVMKNIYRHCKDQFAFRQPVEAKEEEFHSYIVLSAPKAFNKENLRERMTKDLPEVLKNANIDLVVTDAFCFPYQATALPAKPELEAIASTAKHEPKPETKAKPVDYSKAEPREPKAKQSGYARKYSPEFLKSIYELRDKGMTCNQIAEALNNGRKDGEKLKPGEIAGALTWRHRTHRSK
jgi:hypothetical protein